MSTQMDAKFSLTQPFGVIELPSIARGYALFNALTGLPGVHVLEAVPMSPGHFIIFFASPNPKQGLELAQDYDPIATSLVDNRSKEILEAYFGLSKLTASGPV